MKGRVLQNAFPVRLTGPSDYTIGGQGEVRKAPREGFASLEANFRRRLHNQQKCVVSQLYRVSKRNLIGPNVSVCGNLVARALADTIG